MHKEFFQALQDDRRQLGMSQAEFANTLNVSQQTLSKWEAGTAMPRALKLAELLQTLTSTLDENSETVKALANLKSLPDIEMHEEASNSEALVNALRNFKKYRVVTAEHNSSNDSNMNFLNVLRENNKSRHRFKLAEALRNPAEQLDPMAMMAKATSDLARAADAMQKASDSIVKAVEIMRDAEKSKASK